MIIEESSEAAKVIEEISGPDTIHTVRGTRKTGRTVKV